MTLRDQPIEQFVLEHLELLQFGTHHILLAKHRISMPLGFATILLGQRGFGNQRTDACFLGFLGDLRELFLTDPGFFAQAPETNGDIAQSTLDLVPGHRGSLEGRQCPPNSSTSPMARALMRARL